MSGFKYVSKFTFPKEFGFTGSAGRAPVKGYMRGGHVKHKAEGGTMDSGKVNRDPSTQVGSYDGHPAAPKTYTSGTVAFKKYARGGRHEGEIKRERHEKMAKGGKVDKEERDEFAKGGWIKGATKNKGALHRALNVPEGKKISEKKIEKAEHSKNPTMRKRAALAETLKGMHHAKGGLKKYAFGGVVTRGEYAPPNVPMDRYARGGHITAGPKSPSKMSGYPKTAAREMPPKAKFEKYAKGGTVEGSVRRIGPPDDSNGKWADYRKGGMKHKRGGGRC